MYRKFTSKDLLGSAAMLGLATLLLVKLAPAFIDETKMPSPEMPKQAEAIEKKEPLQKKEAVSLAVISLPAPPPLVSTVKQPKEVKPQVTSDAPMVEIKPLTPTMKKADPIATIKPLLATIDEAPILKKPVKVTLLKETKPVEPLKLEKPIIAKIVEEKIQGPIIPLKSTEVQKPQGPEVQQVKLAPKHIETKTVNASPKNTNTVKTGRSLLKFLEHGKGPAIEIIWPAKSMTRDRLYTHLTQCYGMVSAILTGSQFYKKDSSGPWALNPDRYSGFLRQPTGQLPQQEQAEIYQIQHRNSLNSNSQAVRLFPRQADAILLGGLQQLVGKNYLKASHIQGRYILNGSELKMVDIHVDGLSITGDIQLSALYRNCGERA